MIFDRDFKLDVVCIDVNFDVFIKANLVSFCTVELVSDLQTLVLKSSLGCFQFDGLLDMISMFIEAMASGTIKVAL